MKVKQHSFSIDLAEKIGVEKAVLMANIHYWLDWAASHGKNINDGYHWTYNSSTGFAKLFPYWSAKKISNMLRSLEDEGYLISGSFNKAGYDRTKWYTTSDYLIVQNGTMDCTEWDNGSPQTGQPIPNNKPPLKPDVKTPMSKKDFDDEDLIEQGFNIFYSAGLVKKSKKTALDKFKLLVKKLKANPVEIGSMLEFDIKSRIANNQFGFDKLHPSTYLTQQRWEDDNEKANNGFNEKPRKLSAVERQQQRYAELHGQPASGSTMDCNGGNIRGAVGEGARIETFESMDPRLEQDYRESNQDWIDGNA